MFFFGHVKNWVFISVPPVINRSFIFDPFCVSLFFFTLTLYSDFILYSPPLAFFLLKFGFLEVSFVFAINLCRRQRLDCICHQALPL